MVLLGFTGAGNSVTASKARQGTVLRGAIDHRTDSVHASLTLAPLTSKMSTILQPSGRGVGSRPIPPRCRIPALRHAPPCSAVQDAPKLAGPRSRPPSGRFPPSVGACQDEWFPGNDRRFPMSGVTGVDVYGPRQDPLTGVHVGGGYVLIRPEYIGEFGGVAPVHVLERMPVICDRSQTIPPLTLSRKISTVAHFQIIQATRAVTSLGVTSGW